MFCKWCGNRIENNGVPCPSCGNTQTPLESGNGFWDLCGVKPENPASQPRTAVQDKKVGRPKTAEKRVPKKNTDQKKPKASGHLMQIAILCLLLVAIVLTCVGIKKVNDYAATMSMYGLRLSGLMSTVDSGFEEIALYHTTMAKHAEEEAEAEETEAEVVTMEPEVEQTKPDINALLENNDVLLNLSYGLNVAGYSLEGKPECILCMASGLWLENENSEIYWQSSTDGGVTWETLPDEATWVLMECAEDTVYRVLCLPGTGEEEHKVCYYAVVEMPTEADTATEDLTEEPTEAPTEAPTEDTGDGQNIDTDLSGIFG